MDANPYQPPRHEPANPLDQKYATNLLSFRARPVTVLALYRLGGKQLAILAIYFAVAIALLLWMNLYVLAAVMLGILVGALANGFGVARRSVKLWPAQKKVLDWERVERMARGEPLDAGGAEPTP